MYTVACSGLRAQGSEGLRGAQFTTQGYPDLRPSDPLILELPVPGYFLCYPAIVPYEPYAVWYE